MPNWASVTRNIYGSKESLKTIENAIVKCKDAKEPLVKNGLGNMWLGCIITALDGDWEKVRCRGEVIDYEIETGCIHLHSEEAWGEQSEFRQFLKDKFEDLDIIYYCEEPGMDEYYTNDPDCTALYIEIDVLDEDGNVVDCEGTYEATNEDDAITYIEECYFNDKDVEFSTLDEAVVAMKKEGISVCVHEYEYED